MFSDNREEEQADRELDHTCPAFICPSVKLPDTRISAALCVVPKSSFKTFDKTLVIFRCLGFNLLWKFHPNIFAMPNAKAHLMCFQLGVPVWWKGDLSVSQHNLIKWNLPGLVGKQLQGNALVPPLKLGWSATVGNCWAAARLTGGMQATSSDRGQLVPSVLFSCVHDIPNTIRHLKK